MNTIQVRARPMAMSGPYPLIAAEALRAIDEPRLCAWPVRAPSGSSFVALLEAFRPSGGTVPGEILGRLLQEHHPGEDVSLARLVFSGQVFGFEWRGNLWLPMFQFEPADLSIRAGPQEIRAALPAGWPGWRQAAWFAQPQARLGGQCAADLLVTRLPAVLAAALAARAADPLAWPEVPGAQARSARACRATPAPI